MFVYGRLFKEYACFEADYRVGKWLVGQGTQ